MIALIYRNFWEAITNYLLVNLAEWALYKAHFLGVYPLSAALLSRALPVFTSFTHHFMLLEQQCGCMLHLWLPFSGLLWCSTHVFYIFISQFCRYFVYFMCDFIDTTSPVIGSIMLVIEQINK